MLIFCLKIVFQTVVSVKFLLVKLRAYFQPFSEFNLLYYLMCFNKEVFLLDIFSTYFFVLFISFRPVREDYGLRDLKNKLP